MAGGFASLSLRDFPPLKDLLPPVPINNQNHPLFQQPPQTLQAAPPTSSSGLVTLQFGSWKSLSLRSPSVSIPKEKLSSVVQATKDLGVSNNSTVQSLTAKAYFGKIKSRPEFAILGVPCISFTQEDKRRLLSSVKLIVVAKFSHGRPPWKDFSLFLSSMKFMGSFKVTKFDFKHSFVEFELFEDFSKFWMVRTWMIKDVKIRLFKWSESFSPSIESCVAPVWIHMPGIPLYMFDEEVILSLASSFGSPLYIDPKNLSREKIGYLTFCVAMDVRKHRFDNIWIEFVGEGLIVDRFSQKIVYGDIPHFCEFCSHLGHEELHCKLKPTPKETNETNEEAVFSGVEPKQTNAFIQKDLVDVSTIFARLNDLEKPTEGGVEKENAEQVALALTGGTLKGTELLKNCDVSSYDRQAREKHPVEDQSKVLTAPPKLTTEASKSVAGPVYVISAEALVEDINFEKVEERMGCQVPEQQNSSSSDGFFGHKAEENNTLLRSAVDADFKQNLETRAASVPHLLKPDHVPNSSGSELKDPHCISPAETPARTTVVEKSSKILQSKPAFVPESPEHSSTSSSSELKEAGFIPQVKTPLEIEKEEQDYYDKMKKLLDRVTPSLTNVSSPSKEIDESLSKVQGSDVLHSNPDHRNCASTAEWVKNLDSTMEHEQVLDCKVTNVAEEWSTKKKRGRNKIYPTVQSPHWTRSSGRPN